MADLIRLNFDSICKRALHTYFQHPLPLKINEQGNFLRLVEANTLCHTQRSTGHASRQLQASFHPFVILFIHGKVSIQ